MLIIGHRGAGWREPENTQRAVRAGMACADYVEVDTRLSRDGIPVIMHDATLDRTTNGTGAVSDYTVRELQSFDAGKGEQVPTLAEVCSLVNSQCGLFVEIKEPGSETEVCRILVQADLPDLYIVSFHAESIRTVSKIAPGIKTGIICSKSEENILNLATMLGADAVLLKHPLLSRDLVDACRGQGLLLFSWTLNTAAQFRVAFEMGIDGCATDDPCSARNYFGEGQKAGEFPSMKPAKRPRFP